MYSIRRVFIASKAVIDESDEVQSRYEDCRTHDKHRGVLILSTVAPMVTIFQELVLMVACCQTAYSASAFETFDLRDSYEL
jgi:hypothetical protein